MEEKNSTKSLGYNVQESGYRAHPAIANSDLRYLHDPKDFRLNKLGQQNEETKDYQRTGNLVDEFLLNRTNFNDNFILQPEFEDVPTSKNQKKFVELLFEESDEPWKLEDKVLLEDLYDKCYANSTQEKAWSMFKEFKPYLEFTVKAEGKERYSQSDWEELQEMVKNCKGNKEVNRLLFEDKKNTTRFTHLQIIGMKKWGITWKGEVDLLYLNFEDKVIENVDLKTTSKKITSFNYYYDRYKYYRQQALYRELLQYYLVENNIIPKDELDQWTIKTRCMVVKTTGLYQAYCVPIPFFMIKKGLDELKEAAKKIKFYQENHWNSTMSYQKNDGMEILDFQEFKE